MTGTPPPTAPPAGSRAAHAGEGDPGPLAAGPSYLRALRTQWPVAVVFVVVVVASAALVLVLRSPTYEATSKVLVTPVEPTDARYAGLPVITHLGDPTYTIQTAAALVEARDIADAAARDLGEPWTGERVRGAVAVTPQGQTNVLAITATAGDAREAAEVADAYATAVQATRNAALEAEAGAAIERLDEELAALPADQDPPRAQALGTRIAELEQVRLGGDPSISLLEPAQVPSSPAGAPPLLILAAVLAAALALAPAAALMAERLAPGIQRLAPTAWVRPRSAAHRADRSPGGDRPERDDGRRDELAAG
ncbi:MAG TPA: hypothetical protein VFZ77_20020 [Acidimicrobiales bacterium]